MAVKPLDTGQRLPGKLAVAVMPPPVPFRPRRNDTPRALLKNGRTSVNETARILKVSPATVYRYFPRGGRGSNLLAPEQSGLPRVQSARTSKDDQLET